MEAEGSCLEASTMCSWRKFMMCLSPLSCFNLVLDPNSAVPGTGQRNTRRVSHRSQNWSYGLPMSPFCSGYCLGLPHRICGDSQFVPWRWKSSHIFCFSIFCNGLHTKKQLLDPCLENIGNAQWKEFEFQIFPQRTIFLCRNFTDAFTDWRLMLPTGLAVVNSFGVMPQQWVLNTGRTISDVCAWTEIK